MENLVSFTVSDWHDMVHLLEQHPDWREDLRRLLLTDDFMALPGIVRELAEAQKRTELRVEELAEAQKRTENTLYEVLKEQRNMGIELNWLRGHALAQKYANYAYSYFQSALRRVHVIAPSVHLEPGFEDSLYAKLKPEEVADVLRLDVIARGRRPDVTTFPECWLAVEVSAVVDRGDVDRAERRARLLRRAGYPAVPVVAGENLTEGAVKAARKHAVAVVTDGVMQGWDKAVLVVLSVRDEYPDIYA